MNLEDSKILNDYHKAFLQVYFKNKLVNNNIRLTEQEHRNQSLNRQFALIKFIPIIRDVLKKHLNSENL